MEVYSVYKLRSRGRPKSGMVRIWQGEARSAPHAIRLAVEARQTQQLRHETLAARPASDDPYARDPRTIVEEDGQ